MIFLEMRYVFYGLFIFVLGLVTLAWLLGVRTARRKQVPEIWEYAPVGVLLLSGRRTYSLANATAQRLLGLPGPQGTLPDTPWARLLLADRKESHLGAQQSGRHRQVELGEDRVIRWWVSPGPQNVVLLWDVTSYQRAANVAHSLLSTLSHELRNPLGSLRAHVEVLHLPNVSPDARRQSLNILRDETARLAHLVDQMLELGRLDATPELELRPTDVLSLVEQVVTMLRPRAEDKGLQLELVADTALPLALADPERMYQVFFNLVDNAITYSQTGDTITIILEDRAKGLYCEVRDTGPGIPAAELPHITRRFYRGSRVSERGSGLGLAIVEEILKRHHSTLHIESHTEGPDRGTRAFFILQKVK